MLIRKIIRWFRSQKINILKTLIVNFKTLPFNQAVKFPIYVYTGTLLVSIGKIEIKSNNVSHGMIRIGRRNFFAGDKTILINSGIICFYGKFLIEAGTCISNNGTMCLGKESRIGERCNVLVVYRLFIGDFTRIAFETTIMDTDFHTIVNTNSGVVKKTYGEIILGAYNWIGCRSMVKKGTITGDYTIVASLSMLNKDYRTDKKYPLLAGCPAKVVSDGWRRIYSDKNCKNISSFFIKNAHCDTYMLNDYCNIDWDEFCLHGDEVLEF